MLAVYKNKNIQTFSIDIKEKGAVTIIEAVFVFPIMFFIVLLMLLIGSAFFQEARIERLAESAALEASARCENPMLEQLSDGSLPTDPWDNHIKPYRYIFSGYARGICTDVASDLESKISSFGSLGFAGMEAKVDKVTITPHLYMLVSHLDVECSFHVDFPIRMIFSDKDIVFHHTVKIRQPIADPTELVRNVSTVKNLAKRSEIVTNFTNKIKSVMEKIGKYIN